MIWFASISGTAGLYAQHYASDGGTLWGVNPVLISGPVSEPVGQGGYLPSYRAFPGANGNPTIVWLATPQGLFAEQLDLASGARQWGLTTGGTELSTVQSIAWMDATPASDNATYVTYQDSLERIYVKRLGADGTLGGSSPADAGADAGANEDAGTTDAGIDGGPDAGPDAGIDAGEVLDAGPTVDAGNKTDAGTSTPDAGELPDAGAAAPASSGCGCTSASAGMPWSFGLLLLGLVLLRRGRRQSRR